MSQGLTTTFELLASTKNEAAVGVLLPALDSPDPTIRSRALRSLLDRRSKMGQHEVLRRLHTLDADSRRLIMEKPGRIAHALRDALVSADPQTVANGFMAVLWLREYDLTPTLVNALEDAANPHGDGAGRTLLELVDLLYDELAGMRNERKRRDPKLVRDRLVECLEHSVTRYHRHKRAEVVEAFLRLAPRDNPTLNRILSDPHDRNFIALTQTLAKSEHGGVVRLVLSFLDDPQAPIAALHVIGRRTDLKFLRYLFDKIQRQPSPELEHNLKRIDSIAWVATEEQAVLDMLDEEQQRTAVEMVVASGIKRLTAFEVVAYLLNQGNPGGRRAAAKVLEAFTGSEASALVLQALEDDDPSVQAQAVRQLRHRGLPGAFQRQVECLDSPFEEVRQAARESLAEFSFPRFLAAFDTLDEEVQLRTGQLVKKVDPRSAELVVEELQSPSRTRRLRALAVAAAVDVVREIEWAIVERLHDEDHLVRVAAANLLGRCPTRAAEQALRAALADNSILVQQAAEQSLLWLSRRDEPAAAPPEVEIPSPGEPARE